MRTILTWMWPKSTEFDSILNMFEIGDSFT